MTRAARRIAVVALGGVGGSSIAAAELAFALARVGHSVRLLSGRPIARTPPDEASLPLVRRCFGAPEVGRASGAALAADLAAEHRRAPFDEVHVHYLRPLLPWTAQALEQLTGPRPTLVATAHGTDVTRGRAPAALRRAAGRVDRWVVAGPSLDPGVRALGVKGDIEYIPPGIDLHRFRQLEPPGGPPRVFQTTNFRPWKRAGVALAVLAELRRRGHPVRLRWVGDGPDRERLAHRTRRRGLAPWVEWAGAGEVDGSTLRPAHAVLCTSAEESCGLSLVEALACGRPVVAPDLPGLRRSIGGVPGAALVAVPSVGRLADALERALDAPPPAARPALRRFDVRRTARAYLAPAPGRRRESVARAT